MTPAIAASQVPTSVLTFRRHRVSIQHRPPNVEPVPCSFSSVAPTSTQLSNTRTSIVSYTLETISAPDIADTYQLHRQSCASGEDPPGSLPLIPVLDTVVASNLSTTIPPDLQCYKRSANANIFATANQIPDCNSAEAWILRLTLTPESDAPPFQLIGTRRSQ